MQPFRWVTIIQAILVPVLFYVSGPLSSRSGVEYYFMVFVFLQFLHSQEEQWSNFHERWPYMKVTGLQFAVFELVFQLVWMLPLFLSNFPGRDSMLWFFPLLMFANGVWHIVWFWFFENLKRYVPGLITAPIFVIAFVIMYLNYLI